MSNQKTLHYTKIHNNYIRSNLLKEYGVSRKFYIIYILIDKHRSYENISWVTINKILSHCGSKTFNVRSRDTQFKEIINILDYMQEINTIEIITDLSTIRNDACIELLVTKDQIENNFTIITSEEFALITSIQSNTSVENLISTFLYVKSYIFKRNLQEDGSEFSNANEHPEAFFTRIEKICEDTGLARETVNKCLNGLIDNKVLIKYEVGSYPSRKSDKFPIGNSPNIYVLNNSKAQQEIKWALEKLKTLYKVESFLPALKKKHITDNTNDNQDDL